MTICLRFIFHFNLYAPVCIYMCIHVCVCSRVLTHVQVPSGVQKRVLDPLQLQV